MKSSTLNLRFALHSLVGSVLLTLVVACTGGGSESKPQPPADPPGAGPQTMPPLTPTPTPVTNPEPEPLTPPVVEPPVIQPPIELLTGPGAMEKYCSACHTNNSTTNSFRLNYMGESQILDALARLTVQDSHPMAMPPSPISLIPGPGGTLQNPKAIIVAYLREKLVELRKVPTPPPSVVGALPFTPSECYQTSAEWMKFRATMANKIGTTGEPGLGDGYSLLSTYITQCENTLTTLNVKSCFKNLAEYARVSIPHTGSKYKLGFELSDDKYYSNLKSQNQIDGLALPKAEEGINLLDGIPENWREQISASGNKVRALQYRSRTVANPGQVGSYNRLLFLVEGEKYDKWIQFTLPEPTDFTAIGYNPFGDTAPEQLIDMIAVDKTKTPNQIMFAQYWRNSEGKKPMPRLNAFSKHLLGVVPEGLQNQADACYICHANGMRALSPQPASVGVDQVKTLNAFNAKMVSYKRLDWINAITPEAYGPAMGKNIGCTGCHNSSDKNLGASLARGSINSQFNNFHLSHKMMTDLSMPTSKMMYLENNPSKPANVLALQSHVKNLDLFPDSERLAMGRTFVDAQTNGSNENPSISEIFGALNALLFFQDGTATYQTDWPGLISEFATLNLDQMKADAKAVRDQRAKWINQQLNPSSSWYRAEVGQWLLNACEN